MVRQNASFGPFAIDFTADAKTIRCPFREKNRMSPLSPMILVVFIVFWFGLAVPTSLVGSRVGHPKWVAYLACCPFTVSILVLLMTSFVRWPGLFTVALFVFWVPGVVYLWVVALKFARNYR